MKTKQIALLLIGLSIISCANDYEFMEDYQSQDWESSLRQIVSENMMLYSNSDIYLKGYEKTDINSLSQYSFINSESRYPVMTGNKITLAPYEFIRFDTLMCHVKSSHIENIVNNSLNHKDELVAVELQWVVKDAQINTFALFDKESGELVYDNLLYNTITMDAVKMNRLRKHKLTRSETNGQGNSYHNGDYQGGVTIQGTDSFSYTDQYGNWIATIGCDWDETGYWALKISEVEGTNLYCFEYEYEHLSTEFHWNESKNPGFSDGYGTQGIAMALAPTDKNYRIKLFFFIGTATYTINFYDEPVTSIYTNYGQGVVKIITEKPYRSPDYVDKDAFYCPDIN